MRLSDQLLKALQGSALHAHGGHAQATFRFVEQTQNGALTVRTWQCRDPNIDGSRTQAQTDATVLRQTFFGNVEFGHDF